MSRLDGVDMLLTFRRFAVALLPFAIAACTRGSPSLHRSTRDDAGSRLALTPCALPGVSRPARCGTAHVLEDRRQAGEGGRGRVVPLRVVVVPAEQSPALPDPVVYIPGGPGDPATEDVARTLAKYGKVAASRDFVFVDARGMSHGSPLRCPLFDGTDLGTLAGGALPEARLRACLASMDADPAFYTTSAAVDDLDEVLGALGYDRANIVGESYGTFAAQALAKAHPARVRSLALLGVVSPREDFVLRFAENAQTVLENVFAECAANVGCHAHYPNPRAELDAALARLREHPAQVSAQGPDGKRYTATLDADAFALTLRSALYSAKGRGQALGIIHDVAEGRFDGIAQKIVLFPLGAARDISIGAYLSIACGESLPGVSEDDAERATAKTFLGMARVGPVLRACRYWPRHPIPEWLHAPLEGDLPTLLVAGTLDPATPVADLEVAAAKLTNAQRVVFPGEGHVVSSPCVEGIVASFFDHPSAKVDLACVKPVRTIFDAPAK